MRGIWKKIGWGICVVTMVSMLAAGIFLILILYSFKNIQLEEEVLTSGDFIYRVNGDRFFFEGLSEQGKEKESIVVPEEIEGYEVKELTYQYWLSVRGGNFESEKLKQIYIIPNIELRNIGFLNTPNLTKIIMIGTQSSWYDSYSISLGEDTKIYFSTIQNHSDWEMDDRGCILSGFWLSNCNYFYNYDGAENDGYYWSDNYDYGEKITYVPQNPKREGYIFGGWFQEPECINIWNFDRDTLPEAKYNEEGEVLYQETRLYAKWYLQ